jgi:hypothetical protein
MSFGRGPSSIFSANLAFLDMLGCHYLWWHFHCTSIPQKRNGQFKELKI